MEKLIRSIENIIPLSSNDRLVIRELFQSHIYTKGEHLLEIGNVCKYVFFIETGLVRYYMINDGEERTNYFNKEDEFVCNYRSFLPKLPSEIGIQALEETVAYRISSDHIAQLYKNVEHGERFGRLAIEQVFLSAINQLSSFYTDTPEQRYSKFIDQSPDIVQRVPQYYIASFIGVKPPSLSRIRQRLFQRPND
ncbi:Crp/Fnr family transcriptional regulator [Mucilaginibacter sp. HD30]